MLTAPSFRLSTAFATRCVLFAAFLAYIPLASQSQTVGVTQITGSVLDAQRRPVVDAQVRLSGEVSKTTTTASDGSFVFLNLPAGTFRLEIVKAGFNSVMQDEIATATGSTTNLRFTLQSASLTSLTVIGNVSVAAHNGANSINTTPASIVDVPATTFLDQGQLTVNQVLNEEPGVTVGLGYPGAGYFTCQNGANANSGGIASVRGGLPYETESLIDGHAISLGQFGTFSPTFISPYILQNVEVVKGPGATSPSINYAINGTINYRTLEPTAKPEESVDFGMDQFGGNVANFRATGTLPGGRLSYAFDYATQGTQGSDRGITGPTILFPEGPAYLNGTPVNLYANYGSTAGPANVYQSFNQYDSAIVCCPGQPNWSNERNYLAKIRYAFTPSTVLTFTYLGSKAATSFDGQSFPYSDTSFTPPAGYTGSLPVGPEAVTWVGFPQIGADCEQETNLFETEFHTPIGKSATLLLREYTSSILQFDGGPGNSGPTAAGTTSLTTNLYGCVFLNNSTTPTIYNGQLVTLTTQEYFDQRSRNDLNGYTAEIDQQAGNDLLTISYDEEKTSTFSSETFYANTTVLVPGGSSQEFQSLMGRAQFELGQRLNGVLSDNFGSYTDTYTQNAGVSYVQSTQTYQAPRLSLTWRPSANQSFRGAVGFSVAPPYIALLNNNETVSGGGTSTGAYFSETENSGDVAPESAIGFDIGVDTRLHSPDTVLSVDAYQTLLHDKFLQETTQQGTFTCSNVITCPAYGTYLANVTAPLYVTKTSNLGHSEYEGIEVALHRMPPTGWGYRIQGSLQRAFAYDLPAGFYSTPNGPNTTNLAILPNINFQASGAGYNGISLVRIPYSTGYAEVNFRGKNGAYFLGGITYYGPNNTYGRPAFGVVTTSFSQPITRRASLQLSIYNLFNAYPDPYYLLYSFNESGILTPLENGSAGYFPQNVVGPATARLTLHVDI